MNFSSPIDLILTFLGCAFFVVLTKAFLGLLSENRQRREKHNKYRKLNKKHNEKRNHHSSNQKSSSNQ